MSRDQRKAMGSIVRFVSGWRAALLFVTVAAAFLIGLVTGSGSLAAATGAALVAAVVLGAVVVVLALEANRISEWSNRLAEVAEPTRIATERLDLIDAVVGGATRQWREPTLLPWPEDGVEAVLLLPGAAYHLTEVIPLSRELQRRGIPARIAIGEPHWERVRDGLVDFEGSVFALPDPNRTVKHALAVLAMKDWAGYRPYIETAQAARTPTFAKVEGVQDFNEVDTTNRFEPYQTADHILCQGSNDHDALTGARTIVGSSRLERLRRAPLRPQRAPLAVINLNFTYGVRTDDRQQYLDTAIAGCEEAGIPYVVGAHPAERVGRRSGFTTIPISRLLEHATVLVSRFSTVPFEAMARGVPFVYHNPHGEQVPTFQNAGEAFRATGSPGELAAAITEARDWLGDYRDRSATFYDAQVDIQDGRTSEERAADVIVSHLPG